MNSIHAALAARFLFSALRELRVIDEDWPASAERVHMAILNAEAHISRLRGDRVFRRIEAAMGVVHFSSREDLGERRAACGRC